jgi:hypothetical protein
MLAALSLRGWQWVACAPGALDETSPDGAFHLQICRAPMPFAFPGQGSDAAGFAVLRDASGWIAGVVHLEMVGAVQDPVDWSDGRARLKLAAELVLPPLDRSLASRLGADLAWRLRALLGVVPEDSEFR